NRCSVTKTLRALREMDLLSRRMSSTMRGSLPTSAATCCASGLGSTVSRRTRRSSDFDTILDVTTSTSPDCRVNPAAAIPSRINCTRSSPAFTSGMPGSEVIVNVTASMLINACDANAAVFDVVFVVDKQQHRCQGFNGNGIIQRPGVNTAHSSGLDQINH